MNINRIFIVFGVLLIFIIPTTGAQTKTNLKEQVEKIIYYDAKIVFDQTPGFIVGIIAGDSTYVFSYGSQSKITQHPITDSTLFELGGASKVFTVSLLNDLIQEGLFSYEEALSTYVPTSNNTDIPTIFDLVTHQSGLARMPTDFGNMEFSIDNPYAYYSKRDLVDFYNTYSFSDKKGTYEYSNLGFALLELAVEQQTQLSFEEALYHYFLKKNNLMDTRIHRETTLEICKGYSIVGKSVPLWSAPAFGAAVGVKSSMRDLIRFLKLHIHTNEYDDTHQKVVPTKVDKNSYAGKGWHIIQPKKYYNIVAHSGASAGHRVFLGFVKETQTGVVVLSNSKNGTNGLGYLLLKMLNNNFKKPKSKKKDYQKK